MVGGAFSGPLKTDIIVLHTCCYFVGYLATYTDVRQYGRLLFLRRDSYWKLDLAAFI